MKIWQGIILGVVQGITEFLPISSSGHLMLIQKLFGLNGDFLLFDLILHIATLLAVVIVFWRDVFDIISKPFGTKMRMIVVATMPTVIVAIFLKKVVKNASLKLLGFCFLLTAILLFISQTVALKKKITDPINYKHSFVMGFIQGIAVLPGLSRSGTTLSAGLVCGADKSQVTKFSFLMSLPIIVGGFLLECVDVVVGNESVGFYFLPTCFGFIFAFIFGILSIKFMIKLIKNLNLKWFSLYLVLVSILTFCL